MDTLSNAENIPPVITSESETFPVIVGQENIYSFIVSDTNDYTVSIDGGTPEGGVLSDDGEGGYTFAWTPHFVPKHGLTFVDMDELEAASVHSPLVEVCGCFNGGRCLDKLVAGGSDLVQMFECECPEGNFFRSLAPANCLEHQCSFGFNPEKTSCLSRCLIMILFLKFVPQKPDFVEH